MFQQLRDGDQVTVYGNTVLRNGAAVAYGVRQDADTVAKAMTDARDGLAIQLEAFASTTMEYVRQERATVPGRPEPAAAADPDRRPAVPGGAATPADRAELGRLATCAGRRPAGADRRGRWGGRPARGAATGPT